ncbi:ABC transporter substrate-binding protein [Salmonirosea aquatica]|uniref:ABC transporter substrate-binding protein n=1 Tax=Salmonirosea aquatica TaxID=2654236 RepID=A0A7C9BP32_9BACT|nr:ABC transporter substrate-binding protein [Cytophagaceae bacterium SJW1-29]
MAQFTDQMGLPLQLNDCPQRIVSLVPSQTELLLDLGLNDTVVGITRYCLHPKPKIQGKAIIGGTKTPDLALIRKLQPDLILGNKEENRREDIEALRAEFPVWMSDINSLADATAMVREIGRLVCKETSADWLAERIEERFETLAGELASRPLRKKAAYLIWRKPWMVAGGGTFIDAMLSQAGLDNVFAGQPRYPECAEETLKASLPELILLPSEPFPFKEGHLAEIQALCPDAQVLLVNGELFSWYGTRLLRTPAYLRSLVTSASVQP